MRYVTSLVAALISLALVHGPSGAAPPVAEADHAQSLVNQLASLRSDRKIGLVILEAHYGAGSQRADVTQSLQKRVTNDAIDLPVNNETMGGDPAPTAVKSLSVFYGAGDSVKLVEVPEDGTLRLTNRGEAGRAVYVGRKLDAVADPKSRLTDVRKTCPAGLVVLQATYGVPDHMIDVTGTVQGLVWGDSLTVPVDPEVLGDPLLPRQKKLAVTYATSGPETVQCIEKPDGSVLQVGRLVTSLKSLGGRLVDLQSRAIELRKTRPTGLLILDARYGGGNRWKDVTEQVQSLALGGPAIPVNNSTFGDPAPDTVKQLVVTTFDGERTFVIKGDEASELCVFRATQNETSDVRSSMSVPHSEPLTSFPSGRLAGEQLLSPAEAAKRIPVGKAARASTSRRSTAGSNAGTWNFCGSAGVYLLLSKRSIASSHGVAAGETQRPRRSLRRCLSASLLKARARLRGRWTY